MERLPDDEDAEDREFLHGFDRIEQRIARRGVAEKRVKYIKIGAVAVAVVVGVLLIALLGAGAKKVSKAPYTCRPPDGGAYETTFFVIGDWGRLGNGDQRQAAKMMADVAGCMAPDFIISTGDNFYTSGLKSKNDPAFQESFVNVYSQPSLKDVPWYAVLGNHDYGNAVNPLKDTDCAANDLASCPADCCYTSVWEFTGNAPDARWHLSNGSWSVPGLHPGLLSITMIDTNPFMTRYLKEAWAGNAGGILAQNASAVREQLEARLAVAADVNATWRFVVGHHPVASFGEHCDYAMEGDCLYMDWLATMMKQYGVAAYFCGHDHDMQVIHQLSDPGDKASPAVWPLYVVSGAGSEVRKNEGSFYRERKGYHLPFFMDDQGFAAVRVNETNAVIDVYTSNRFTPMYTEVLEARDLGAAAAAGAKGAGARAGAGAAPRLGHGRRRALARRPLRAAG